MAELIVVFAVIAILTAAALPLLLPYWRQATVNGAAQELATGLNRGRQLAISQSQTVSTEVVGNQYRYRCVGCTDAHWVNQIWVGPGSDSNGLFSLDNVTLTVSAPPGPAFDYLGAASPAVTFTVTDPQSGVSRNVAVSVTGRVQVQ
jgi:Tfp pilus assembly protein FimT